MVNGSVCGYVAPSRGLKQRDLISPYLFILVIDTLCALLSKATLTKDVHGVKASRNGPEIFHLLFTDDSLLFARAT